MSENSWRKPTISDLEAILNEPGKMQIEITPDGSLQVMDLSQYIRDLKDTMTRYRFALNDIEKFRKGSKQGPVRTKEARIAYDAIREADKSKE